MTAVGLPDGLTGDLQHCDRPMTWRGTSSTWEGRPGDGASVDDCRYACDTCGTTAEVHVRTPDGAVS